MKNVIFLFFLLISIQVFARGGSDVGNGGVTVECFNANGSFKNSVVLDHLEAERLYGLKAEMGPDHLPLEEKLEIAFKRIERLNPVRANRYRKAIQGWALKNIIFQDEPMDLQSDTVPSLIPNNCALRQIAIRTKILQSTSWSTSWWDYFSNALHIFRPAWDRLSNTEKSILILHELLYWETAIAGPSLGSLPARQLNAVIFSRKIDQLKIAEWMQLARSYNLPDVEISGLNVDPNQIVFSNDKLAEVKAGKFEPLIGEIEIQGHKIKVSNFVKFYPNGSLFSTYTENENKVTFRTLRGDLVAKDLLHFNKSETVIGFGNIHSSGLVQVGSTHVQCGDSPKTYIPNASLNFQSANLTCWAKVGTKLELPEAQFVVVKEGQVLLSDQGIDWNAGSLERHLAELKGRMRMKTLNGTLIFSFISQVESNRLWRGELARPTQINITDHAFEIKNTVFVKDSHDSPLGGQNRLYVLIAEPTKRFDYYAFTIADKSDRCPQTRIQIEVGPVSGQDYPHGYIRKFMTAQTFWWRNPYSRKKFKVRKGSTVAMTPKAKGEFDLIEIPNCIEEE